MRFLFSDQFKTRFMQAADVFESFKVIVCNPVTLDLADDRLEAAVEAAKTSSDDKYRLVAAYEPGGPVHYADPEVKVISDGTRWCLLQDYITAKETP